MPHPVLVASRDPWGLCPHEAPSLSARLRRLARAPLVARVGRGWVAAQTPEAYAARVARALEALTGGPARVMEPPEPRGGLEALTLAVELSDAGHYWLAHEALEHAWRLGHAWLHPGTVATAAWVKAQEGDPGSALWAARTLLPRVNGAGGYRVDEECALRVVVETLTCRPPDWAGECLAARVHAGLSAEGGE